MKIELMLSGVLALLSGLAAVPARAAGSALEPMPAPLETHFALSALPPPLRDDAAVYLLDTKMGYRLSKPGASGITCLVERTQWQDADFRDDVFVPLCYDEAGAKTHFKVDMDVAAMRAQGRSAAAVKATVEKRYRDKTYTAPAKPGLSYMIMPVFRAPGPPDMRVHTMSMPHLMFYAPGLSNEDIGARPNLADHASLQWPFIDRQGNAEHSYMIQMVGKAEKTKIMADEKPLLDDLCAWRAVLCLTHEEQH
ncbi:MAG: hypothetical protein JSS16_11305 [Proteobacteria bacterium]|nr:hypothetical protein [Pseudomonadota bacterium]